MSHTVKYFQPGAMNVTRRIYTALHRYQRVIPTVNHQRGGGDLLQQAHAVAAGKYRGHMSGIPLGMITAVIAIQNFLLQLLVTGLIGGAANLAPIGHSAFQGYFFQSQ